MNDLQIGLTLAVFAAVILGIAFDLLDMAVAALCGVCVLLALGILNETDLLAAFGSASGPLALLAGGMVVAHVLGSTGIFDVVGDVYLRATGGSGKRFLLLLVVLVAVVCAILPNATTVIILAPIIIRVSRALGVGFVGPMILTAIVSNAAGMLTLVGDPATFLVGSAIGMTFMEYLREVSLAGVVALLVIVPLLPRLLPDVWQARITGLPTGPVARLQRPGFAAFALVILALMVVLFLVGDRLPHQLVPPAVAIIGATLTLVLVYKTRVEPVDDVLRAMDWKTLVFLAAIFCLVQAVIKTGLLQGLSVSLYHWFGNDLGQVALALMGGLAVLSSLLPNVPVVAIAVIVTKGYLVAAQAVPEYALAPGFTDWPDATIPVFAAMMFGGTLGGNATVIGASANIVSAGICSMHGERVTFMRFLRYGLPVAVAQIAAAALFLLWMFWSGA